MREDLALTYEVETQELRGRCYPHAIVRAPPVSSTLFMPSTRVGHHRSHLARDIGAVSSFRATFYELSRHNFIQIIKRSSGESFDLQATPSAHVSLSDVLTLANMQRIALGSFRTWSTPRPTNSSKL